MNPMILQLMIVHFADHGDYGKGEGGRNNLKRTTIMHSPQYPPRGSEPLGVNTPRNTAVCATMAK